MAPVFPILKADKRLGVKESPFIHGKRDFEEI